MAHILRCAFEEPHLAPSFAMRVKMCIDGAFLHRNFLCKKQGTSSPGKQGIWYKYDLESSHQAHQFDVSISQIRQKLYF